VEEHFKIKQHSVTAAGPGRQVLGLLRDALHRFRGLDSDLNQFEHKG
jgi:hypothetical protein